MFSWNLWSHSFHVSQRESTIRPPLTSFVDNFFCLRLITSKKNSTFGENKIKLSIKVSQVARSKPTFGCHPIGHQEVSNYREPNLSKPSCELIHTRVLSKREPSWEFKSPCGLVQNTLDLPIIYMHTHTQTPHIQHIYLIHMHISETQKFGKNNYSTYI